MIERQFIDHTSGDVDCNNCSTRLTAGDFAWVDDDTGLIGCSQRCCKDAVRKQRQSTPETCVPFHAREAVNA